MPARIPRVPTPWVFPTVPATIGDLNNNTSDDYANGTATSSVSSDDSDDSSDSSDSDYYEEPTGDGNGYEANY